MNTSNKIRKQLGKCLARIVTARLLVNRLKSIGIILNDKQILYLESNTINELPITFFNDEQLGGCFISLDELPAILKTFVDSIDDEELRNGVVEAARQLGSEDGFLKKYSSMTLPILKKRAVILLKEEAEKQKGFTERLNKTWEKPFKLYESYILLLRELGSECLEEYNLKSPQEASYVFSVELKLHARACQICSEILALFRSGFADGAHARWRTMHEIAVIAWFISENGEEAAKRYLDYNAVEVYKSAVSYQNHCISLGYDPLPKGEMKDIEQAYERLRETYGRNFVKPYGWASSFINLGQNIRKTITFDLIEESVGMQHMRPYYKFASRNIHAGCDGISNRLGLIGNSGNLLLCGPTNTGFADPANGAVVSLLQITSILLKNASTIVRMGTSYALKSMADEVQKSFTNRQLEIEKYTY